MKPTSQILVVEDEAIVAMDLQDRLEKVGYEVVANVDTADDAVRAADQFRPDLVLMDIRLREGDGIQAAREIQALYHLPVIFLTAYADETTVQRAKEIAGFGYLLKPVRERELHSTIQMALSRAEAERRLRESERLYAATVNSIGEGIVAVDAECHVALLNRVAESLTGWAEAEARGRPIESVLVLVHEQTREGLENPVRQALRDNRAASLAPRVLLVTREGREIPVEDTATPIPEDGAAPPRGAVFAFRDISEKKKAEAQIRQAQKLESLGVLAGGIAHDFNNLLTPILGFANLARSELPPRSPAAPMLAQIEEAAQRASEKRFQGSVGDRPCGRVRPIRARTAATSSSWANWQAASRRRWGRCTAATPR